MRILLWLLTGSLVLAGCRQERPLPMEREVFMRVMVELRRASIESADTIVFRARKAAILKRAGVTEAQLRAYARTAAGAAGKLADEYDTIGVRVRRAPGQ